MRFFDKLNTPKVLVVALALVVAVNALIFVAHNYRFTENTATASPATATEPEGVTASSADATPTENSEGDSSGKQEQAGAKEAAGAVGNPVSKQPDSLNASEANPQPPSGLNNPSITPPPLNQPAVYPTPAATEEQTGSSAIPTTYPQSVYGSNSWSGTPNDDSASPTE